MLYQLGDKRPQIHGPTHYIAENATVIGDVVLQNETSVWFNVVIRGDMDTIAIGEGSNIQDGAVLHTDEGIPLTIGRRVTVGHQAMLHGCDVGDGTLIGINAVVLNKAKIGKGCIVGANSLVTEGKVIPDYSLVMGSPARVVKQLDPGTVTALLDASAQAYIDKISHYQQQLTAL